MHDRNGDVESGQERPLDGPVVAADRSAFGPALIMAIVVALVVGLVPFGAWSVTAQNGRPGAPVFIEPGVRGPSVIATRGGIDPAAVAAGAGVTPGFVYQSALTGFSANLTDSDVAILSADVNVSSIVIDRQVSIADYTTYIPRSGADTSSVARIGSGGSHGDVGIAIIDTGIASVSGLNVSGGTNCVGGSSYADDQGHGTHVAGIAAAPNNGSGVAGVAAGARVYAVKVLNAAGQGNLSQLICGLDWVAANAGGLGINVANLSLGLTTSAGPTCGNGASALREAVCGVIGAGVPVVVAAGNNRVDASSFSPANYPEVITVASLSDTNGRPGGGGAGCTASGTVTGDDQFSAFSNFGSLIDVIAPGGCITSLSRNGGTEVRSGTSMAAPAVAGAVAMYGGLGGITVSQNSTFGLRNSASGTSAGVLYIGDGSNSGATATPTRQANATSTPTRQANATSTPTRQATATRQATSTPGGGRPPRGTSVPRATATAPQQATATPTRQAGATATPTRQATATPRGGRPPRTRASDVGSPRETSTPTRQATAGASVSPTRQATSTATSNGRPPRSGSGSTSAPDATSTPNRVTNTPAPAATRSSVRPPRITSQGADIAATIAVQRSATEPPTATTEPPTATTVPPTATTVPPTETAVPATATTAPTETMVPTAVPTEVATEIPTEIPTAVPTEIPTEVPTEIPTEVPTEVVPTVTPTIAPVNATDTLGQGTAWYVLDDDETTTWYLAAPEPVVAPVPVVDEPVVDPAASADGEIAVEAPTEIPAAVPAAEPEDLALVLDLGYVQTVGAARWLWTDTTWAHGAVIEISLDGETWQTVGYPDTWNAIPGEYQSVDILADARYVRFMFPNVEQLPQVGGLAEVEILPVPTA